METISHVRRAEIKPKLSLHKNLSLAPTWAVQPWLSIQLEQLISFEMF